MRGARIRITHIHTHTFTVRTKSKHVFQHFHFDSKTPNDDYATEEKKNRWFLQCKK